MKNDKIEITKIKIQVKDYKLELSLEEAKELKQALETLFPRPEIQFVERPIPSWRYWQVTTTPYYDNQPPVYNTTPIVYCANLSLNNG